MRSMRARSRAHPREQLRGALDRQRRVPGAEQGRGEAIAHEGGVVGDDDRLGGGHGGRSHVKSYRTRARPPRSARCRIYQVLAIIRRLSRLAWRDRALRDRQPRGGTTPPGACMATCPECDAEIEVDEFDVDKGDLISCPDCGSNLEVTSTSPLELEAADEDDDDDDDDDDDEDEDDDFDDDGDEVDDETTKTTGRTWTSAARPAARAGRRRLAGRCLARTAKSAALDRALARAAVARSSPTAAASTARTSRTRPPQALGPGALCVTADSPSYPRAASRDGRAHRARVRLPARDHPDRRDRATRVPREPGQPLLLLQARAVHPARRRSRRERGIPVIADGSNADDRGDYRPGRQAAREFGVRSPLDEAGLTKDGDPRAVARAGLPTWDEPASACLSSRIPYFSEVTEAKLRMIERAEEVLRDLGFRVCRVRHHDTHRAARARARRDCRARSNPRWPTRSIASCARSATQHVTVDLRGYRLGSLNDALRLRPV